MKILGISGTIVGTKTRVLVENVLEEILQMSSGIEEVDIELLDLKDYNIQFCDGRDPATYTGDTKIVIDKVCCADAYIIGTPIFQGSMTGVLKNLFDLIPPTAFRKKVIGFVANGGTYQHFLVVENQLKPIGGYFRSYIAPGFVYAHSEHFDSTNQIVDQDVKIRIGELAKEVVSMSSYLRN
ncbi:NADPH-dependent FMN reductase [Bacillus sp. Marseille-P3661]|uniref:NADPH-dependent FMN reductase n=1 Tax=Bacillus sp. Marseille-P3661 TaxID=1936234 RepID=UPI000C83F3C2|nr:NAD(P)H-dependent oxidoreductase [Bacillus sp. Marseille-P3661]